MKTNCTRLTVWLACCNNVIIIIICTTHKVLSPSSKMYTWHKAVRQVIFTWHSPNPNLSNGSTGQRPDREMLFVIPKNIFPLFHGPVVHALHHSDYWQFAWWHNAFMSLKPMPYYHTPNTQYLSWCSCQMRFLKLWSYWELATLMHYVPQHPLSNFMWSVTLWLSCSGL